MSNGRYAFFKGAIVSLFETAIVCRTFYYLTLYIMKKLIPLLLIPLVLAGCSGGLSSDAAKEKVEGFINNTLMAGAPIQATVTGVSKENGLFKIVVDAGGQTVDSYLTADGALFFPQAMNIAEIEEQAAALGDLPPTGAPVPPVDGEAIEIK